MLASITPLGERGRQSTWGVTVIVFLLGALGAGAAVGAALGALGSLAPLGAHARPAILLVAVVVAMIVDAGARRVPGPRRQVDERWLDRYRGWVYGLGFGSQLGLGLTTVVASAATYVALLAALLAGGARGGALVMGCFGAIRGLAPLAASQIHAPAQLLALHRRLDRWRGPIRWIGVLALALIAAAGALEA